MILDVIIKKIVVLDPILLEHSDFRRYSTKIAILDVILQIQWFDVIPQKIVTLDVILQKCCDLLGYSN